MKYKYIVKSKKKFNGLNEATTVSNEIVSATDGIKVIQCKIISIQPISRETNDSDLKHDIEIFQRKEPAEKQSKNSHIKS